MSSQREKFFMASSETLLSKEWLRKADHDIGEEMYSKAGELEAYAVEIRYPDDMFEPDLKETKQANVDVRPGDKFEDT